MGCPAGIGPEIILKYFSLPEDHERPAAVVIGDFSALSYYADRFKYDVSIIPWTPGEPIQIERGVIPLFETSHLAAEDIHPGHPSKKTAVAMADAIIAAVRGIQGSIFSALCTCPISKIALQESGHYYPGHTEMLAALTASPTQVMMMAGRSLRITLATIHCALAQVPELLQEESLCALFSTTHQSLKIDFDIAAPRIAVAALNPHAGEGGMFGREEEQIIIPAMKKAKNKGINLHGPFPPDTIFFKAAQGHYDAVVCMYHDQGLIPFKLLHFSDGVNVTLGLPIVRTSVDHGTAYDIAGKSIADPASLVAAVELATTIAGNRARHKSAPAVN
ncbi:MAG: 4-hydroxythreonine-4-phosphate dehydrogenase PdxA [Proteobacteria bacterium]|nr:4-hydroxythreonine-4-phosphate dehydrogenase PdxA [Pseudomonadota bacterium]MBU1058050.1 4-hydroxythreonine-4-phosphate dehydrogenase PdxA [Pseudomonadota bacterium]